MLEVSCQLRKIRMNGLYCCGEQLNAVHGWVSMRQVHHDVSKFVTGNNYNEMKNKPRQINSTHRCTDSPSTTTGKCLLSAGKYRLLSMASLVAVAVSCLSFEKKCIPFRDNGKDGTLLCLLFNTAGKKILHCLAYPFICHSGSISFR